MVEKTKQNLEVINRDAQETRDTEVVVKKQSTHQTSPIERKLMDFSFANKTKRFSVRDLFKR